MLPGQCKRIQCWAHLVLLLGVVTAAILTLDTIFYSIKNGCRGKFCQGRILPLIFVVCCIFYFIRTILQYDENLLKKQKDIEQAKDDLAKHYQETVAEMDSYIAKSMDTQASLAERSFESKRRDFQRFMQKIARDLLNHSLYPTCVWDKPTPERQTWRLKAGRGGMQPNEPITFCYCSDPNHLLMRTVGFVLPDNPFNRIMVKPRELRECLTAASAEGPGAVAPQEFSKWRQEQIEENLQDPEEDGPGVSMFFVGRHGGGTQWNPLWLNLCGLAMATSMDGEHWSRCPGGVDEYFGVLKKASWHIFDTTLEEDQETIKAEGLSENRQLALAFRIQQKEILTEALNGFYKQLTDAQAKAAAA